MHIMTDDQFQLRASSAFNDTLMLPAALARCFQGQRLHKSEESVILNMPSIVLSYS